MEEGGKEGGMEGGRVGEGWMELPEVMVCTHFMASWFWISAKCSPKEEVYTAVGSWTCDGFSIIVGLLIPVYIPHTIYSIVFTDTLYAFILTDVCTISSVVFFPSFSLSPPSLSPPPVRSICGDSQVSRGWQLHCCLSF